MLPDLKETPSGKVKQAAIANSACTIWDLGDALWPLFRGMLVLVSGIS